MCVTPAFAEERSDGYFEFVAGQERMSSNGSFVFDFRVNLLSDEFTANGSSLTVVTQAWVSNTDVFADNRIPDGSVSFTVKLCKKTIVGGVTVGSYTAYANGVRGGLTFNNIEQGATYYLQLTAESGFEHTMNILMVKGRFLRLHLINV